MKHVPAVLGSLVPWCAAMGLALSAAAQAMQIELRGTKVVAVVAPADLLLLGKNVGLESELTMTSRPLTATELSGAHAVELGEGKPGLFAVAIRGESKVLVDLLWIEGPKGKPLELRCLAPTAVAAPEPKMAGVWSKYWHGIDGEVMKEALKNAAKPLLQKSALKAPVLLLSCGTAAELPPMLIVCQDQLKDYGVDVVAELVKHAADVLVTKKKLTSGEAKQVKAAVETAQAVKSLVLGKDLFDKITGLAFAGASAATELTTGDTKMLGGIDVAKETTNKYKVVLEVVNATKNK